MVISGRSATSPPSNPASAAHTFPSASVTFAEAPALMRTTFAVVGVVVVVVAGVGVTTGGGLDDPVDVVEVAVLFDAQPAASSRVEARRHDDNCSLFIRLVLMFVFIGTPFARWARRNGESLPCWLP